jgi:hypothetical protein
MAGAAVTARKALPDRLVNASLSAFPFPLVRPRLRNDLQLLSEVAMAKLVLSVFFLCVSSISLLAQQPVDYRSRTI